MENYNPRNILEKKRVSNADIVELYEYLRDHSEISIDDYRDVLSSYQGNGGNTDSDDRGMLDEYYTPEYVCEHIYNLAKKYGYNHGNILEPSCAVGRLIRPFYEKKDYNAIEAFEINDTSRNICKMLYPEVELHENYFETAFLEWPRFRSVVKKTWLKYADFDLVVGNPPFGKHNNKYAGIFSKKQSFATIDIFFIYYGLTLLKKGGLLIYVLPTSILSTGGDYTKDKERIAEIADFVDAYRLPKIFKNTPISTDILVLRRK